MRCVGNHEFRERMTKKEKQAFSAEQSVLSRTERRRFQDSQSQRLRPPTLRISSRCRLLWAVVQCREGLEAHDGCWPYLCWNMLDPPWTRHMPWLEFWSPKVRLGHECWSLQGLVLVRSGSVSLTHEPLPAKVFQACPGASCSPSITAAWLMFHDVAWTVAERAGQVLEPSSIGP